MSDDRFRWVVVAAALAFVAVKTDLPGRLLGGAAAPSAAPYSGPLQDLHAAARSMAPEHRAAMAEAFGQVASSMRSDTLGLVGTTRQWQRAIQGALQFGYRDGGRVDQRYPAVADAIQAEVARVAGPDDVKIVDRQRFIDCPAEIAKAVR